MNDKTKETRSMTAFTPPPQIARAWYCVGVAHHKGLDPNRLTTEQHDRIHGEFDRMLDQQLMAANEEAFRPVRELHQPIPHPVYASQGAPDVCAVCHSGGNRDHDLYPCPTIRALDTKETNA